MVKECYQLAVFFVFQKGDSREVTITQDKFFADGVSQGMEFEIAIVTVCNCSDRIILQQIVLGLEASVHYTAMPLCNHQCQSEVKKI